MQYEFIIFFLESELSRQGSIPMNECEEDTPHMILKREVSAVNYGEKVVIHKIE